MLFENAFKCSFQDCAIPCMIAFFVTLVFVIIGHIMLYFRLVAISRAKYGIRALPDVKDIDT
jgi:hypothetical protein